MKISKLTAGVSLLLALNMTGGCQMLDNMAGTTTTDADAKFNLPPYTGLKLAVGCKDFENQGGWGAEWELGNNLSIMLESALFDTGRFVLVEREKLADVIAEQDLASSGRTAPAKKTAVSGLIRPARYLATGAITTVEENQSGSAGGVSAFGVTLGGGKANSQITIIAKLIDTTTGEIVAKKSITGKAGKVALGVGISGTIRGHGFGTAMGGFAKTPLAEAAQDCINQAALFFALQMEQIPFEGSVIKVSASGEVIVNRGSEFGVAVGQNWTMTEQGELLTDSDTGAVLGNEQGKVLGTLTVARVQEKLSYCTVAQGEKNPPPGTTVSK